MKAFTRLNPRKIEHRYLKEFLPIFTDDIPDKVQNLYKYVPMELAMVVLLATTITATSIQRTTEQLSVYMSQNRLKNSGISMPELLRVYTNEFPHPNNIRATLKEYDTRTIIAKYRAYSRKLVKKLKKNKLFRRLHGKYGKKGIAAAMDITEVDYFGDEDQYTAYTKGRSAAKLCHAYLTIQIVCPGFRLILDVEPIYRDSDLGKKVRRLLRRYRRLGLKLDPIYLDRGFHRIDVLKTLVHDFNRLSILPVIRSNRIKKAIVDWYEEHGYTAGKKTLFMGTGKNEVNYCLIFAPLSEDEREKWRKKPGADEDHIWNDFLYFCLPTIPVSLEEGEVSIKSVFEELSQMYRKRWGIETGNRVAKGIWGWTTSTSYELRIWLMWNAITVYNLWVMANLDVIEKKGVPKLYQCPCNGVSPEEIKKIEKAKQDARKEKEQWVAPFVIKPLEPLRYLCDILAIIATRIVDRYYMLEKLNAGGKEGYDPPDIINIGNEKSPVS